MKTIAIAQARMGSTRFPGKVMADLGGKPVLAWVNNALWRSPGVNLVVIATSAEPADDVIEDWCKRYGALCFRGSETDVLDRFYQCAVKYSADVVLRLTCDCPFLDPNVVGQVIQLRQMSGAAYCSNQPTWPDGLDVECFTFAALSTAWREAFRSTDRDTVTQFIIRNRDRFPAEYLICPFPGAHKERWVLDTEKDYELCKAIAARWHHPTSPSCTDIMRILDNEPELRKLNAGAIRNERFYEGLAGEELPAREFGRSNALFTRAARVIPGGSQTFSKSYVHFPAGAAPLYVSHGDGARVFDVDGNDYVDLVSALLPVVLGYRDPDVDYAVRRQLSAGMSLSLATRLECELAERLRDLIPCAEMVKFGKNGTDVTTAAVRLARAYTGVDRVLVGGYHGWADWSIGATPNRIGIPDRVGHLSHSMRMRNDLLSLNASYSDQIAAVIVEPMGDEDYLRFLRKFCSENGIILIFDEIKTGFRYSMGGAQKLWGVIPDLACFGKSMGNGMPISALVGKAPLMKMLEKEVFYSGTFFGDTTALAASLATIKKMEDEKVIEHLWSYGRSLFGILPHNLDYISFEGHPPLIQIKFKDHKSANKNKIKSLFIQEMVQQGVLVLTENGISYSHKYPELQRIKSAYNHTLDVISESMMRGDIDKRLKGVVSAKPVREVA